ncbi:MAG: hypothetical protein GQ556_00545 [Desulfobacterales bacterium]|nr:hypothetical protein [Desulfobacterales bacterium]
MNLYEWVEEENGKEMLSFFEELRSQIFSIPVTGSLAVGMGKCVGGAIRAKSAELNIPMEEAVDHFNVTLKTKTSFS